VAYLPLATSLVGRAPELTALEEATSQRGSVTLLGGVPGIGKSRLALEVGGLAAQLGMTVLWGRCFEGEDARAFAPWVEALGGYVRELDKDRLQRHLGQHEATLAQIIPNVRGVLSDLPPAPSTTPGEDMSIVAGLDNDVARVIAYVHHGFCLAAGGELSASRTLITEGYEIANRLNQPFFGAFASVWAGITVRDLLDPVDADRW
jgi:hypothetical protein